MGRSVPGVRQNPQDADCTEVTFYAARAVTTLGVHPGAVRCRTIHRER